MAGVDQSHIVVMAGGSVCTSHVNFIYYTFDNLINPHQLQHGLLILPPQCPIVMYTYDS